MAGFENQIESIENSFADIFDVAAKNTFTSDLRVNLSVDEDGKQVEEISLPVYLVQHAFSYMSGYHDVTTEARKVYLPSGQLYRKELHHKKQHSIIGAPSTEELTVLQAGVLYNNLGLPRKTSRPVRKTTADGLVVSTEGYVTNFALKLSRLGEACIRGY